MVMRGHRVAGWLATRNMVGRRGRVPARRHRAGTEPATISGGTTYVVWDPGYRYDPEFAKDIYMVFESRWVHKSIF